MKIIVGFITIILSCISYSQSNKEIISQDSLIGIWQADNNLLAAGLADNYQFYTDSTFRYNFNSMTCGMRRLWSILGNYKLEENKLILTITSTIESVGGYIEEAGSEEGENGFMIVGDKMEIINQNKPSFLYFKLDKYDNKESSLEINFRRFFKLSNDPNAYN